MLIAQGVDAVLFGEYQQGGVGELMPSDFSSIQVPEDQAPTAKKILLEYQLDSQTKPENNPDHNRVFLALMALLMLIVSISIFLKIIFNV